MNVGLILLAWLGTGIATVFAMMASGIFSVQIEIDHDDKKQKDSEDEEDD